MPSTKLSDLISLAGAQVPGDLAYVVDMSAGAAGSKKSTLNDLFAIITKNIADGAVRFQGTFAPPVSAADQGALYYNDTTDTFQASRNASAYDNVLVGTGLNQQVAVFGSPVDSIDGFGELTYNNTPNRILLMNSTAAANDSFENRKTTALNPEGARLRVRSLELSTMDGVTPNIAMTAGRSGPNFPLAGAELGQIVMSGANNVWSGLATLTGSVGMTAIATQNHSAGVGGTGFVLDTSPDGAVTRASRLQVQNTGAVLLATEGSFGVTSSVGAQTRVLIGVPGTIDADCAVQIARSSPGGPTTKTLLVFANASQTGTVFGTRSSTSGDQFQIRVVPGDVNHFLSLLGTGTAPGVSAATQWRIYANGSGQLLLSEGGGAYARVTAGGPVGGSTNQIQFNNSNVFGGAAGFEYQAAANPTVLIQARADANRALRILPFTDSYNNAPFQVRDVAGTVSVEIDPLSAVSDTVFIEGSGSNRALGFATYTSGGGANEQAYFSLSSSGGFVGARSLGTGAASGNLLDQANSGSFNGGGSAGLYIVANNASGILVFGTGGSASANERMRITSGGAIVFANTVTPGGTTGNQTINKPSGTVNIAAAGTAVTVTNNLVTANSIVFAVLRTNDATARILNVVPAAGSFTINIASATGEVSIGWFVINN